MFNVINTQEELDAILSERIGRAKAAVHKEYEGFVSPDDMQTRLADAAAQIDALKGEIDGLTAKGADFDATISGLNAEIAKRDERLRAYETDSVKTRIALEYGIPYEMAGRLTGDDEEGIRKDAQMLAQFVTRPASAPAKTPESSDPVDGVTAAFMRLNPNLKFD